MGKKLVCGVGLNDANYQTRKVINGKVVVCSYYSTWKGILMRCYNKKARLENPTYENCAICDEWLTFSKFKSWMETQDWEGKAIDKDIIKKGNKVYCPDFCAFVTTDVNNFVITRRAGNDLKGYNRRGNSFYVYCNNPEKKECEYLGRFFSESEARDAWLSRKREIAKYLASKQTDKRVADALLKAF